MKLSKSLGGLLENPLFAVAFCAVGGVGLWYYGAAPTTATPAAKPESGRTTLERTRPHVPRTPFSDRLAAPAKSAESRNSHSATSPGAPTQGEHAAKAKVSPREDVAKAELAVLTKTSGPDANELEESKQADELAAKETEEIASNLTEPAAQKGEVQPRLARGCA